MAAKMAAARNAAMKDQGSYEDYKDPNEVENQNFSLRDSTEAVQKAQRRFMEFQVLAEVEMSFEEEVDIFLADEPEDKESLAWYQWAMACLTESFEARMGIMALVIINGIIIGVEADHGDKAESFFEITEVTFVVIFFIEAALKIFGFGFNYFKDGWNITDFIIVVGSIVQETLDTINHQPPNPTSYLYPSFFT